MQFTCCKHCCNVMKYCLTEFFPKIALCNYQRCNKTCDFSFFVPLSGFFCVGTRRYGIPRNENDESIVCMSVLY